MLDQLQLFWRSSDSRQSVEMMLLCDDVIMFRILALILIIYSQSRVHHRAM